MNPRRHPHAARPAHTRRHAAHRRLLSLLLFALLSAAARAQTPPALPADEASDVINVRTDFISLRFSVSDSRGRRVTGLMPDDFELRDNGRAVRPDHFAQGTTRAAFAFALDASGSVRENIARQREAAAALLARFGSGARAAVVAFADRPSLALPFTADAERVRAAFQIDSRPERRTAIFDAALAAVRAFDALDDAGQQGASMRRIVVLVSDGLDNASAARPVSVIEEARAREVSIYVVHFPLYEPRGDRLAVRAPARGFRDLAARTGGAYFLLADPSHGLDPHFSYDLAPVFKAIADDLQSQYEIGLQLDEAARRAPRHTLEVTLGGDRERKLSVRPSRFTYTLKP